MDGRKPRLRDDDGPYRGVLDETVSFLEGRPVNPEDDSYYDLPGGSFESASLYEHCVRAIRHGLSFGAHGLPLIGSGDWNDGMNRVGVLGQGESVWLGFFLCEVLRRFGKLAAAHGDPAFAEFCREEGARLHLSLEEHGWDGALRPGAADYLMLVEANIGFNKVNAVEQTRLDYQVDLTQVGQPMGMVTVTQSNPAEGQLPCDPGPDYGTGSYADAAVTMWQVSHYHSDMILW